MPNKHQLLEQLRVDIIQRDICPDLRETAAQLVMGAGNPDADIVLIGEAPGKKEDEQGVPFVGASGRFLDEMLGAANLERSDVYITNIVKYRPPNNRDPKTEEKNAFWPYLLRQLEIISPRAIITLGRHSGSAFLPNLVIGKDHGKQHAVTIDGHDYTVIPLYHPAAALYNGSMRPVLKEDFLRATTLARQNS